MQTWGFEEEAVPHNALPLSSGLADVVCCFPGTYFWAWAYEHAPCQEE